MSETTNRFDLRETLGELKDFIRGRAEAMGGQAAHKPTIEQLEAAVLAALVAEPKNAAQVVASIALASAGSAKISASQVHPVLAKLTEAGFLTSKSKADRKVFAITETGREALAKASENIPEVSDETKTVANWLNFDPNFLKTAAKLAPAINDIAKTGTRSQQEKATQVLEEARRQIHLILAEG